MAYRVSILPFWDGASSILQLDYSGTVSYAERSAALDEMSPILVTTTIRRILVDFSNAALQTAPDGERLDFVSRSILAPGFDGCRVAMVGLRDVQAQAQENTASVRRLEAQRFETREEGLRWLGAIPA